MSVTFHSNIDGKVSSKESPCLCAQMAELWVDAMDGIWNDAVRENLSHEANPSCPFCEGTGVEVETMSDAPSLNLANDNARLLLQALGLSDELWGSLSVAEARRAIMRARSRSDLSPFTRPNETVYGRPQTNEDGSIQLRPVRLQSMGVNENRMASYITRFANFVEASASRGATSISWD